MSDLDYPLFPLGGSPFTIRNACEGVGIFGGTGSGKTSGSGATLARAYLDTGFGGLVLTVKPEDKNDWLEWAEQAGRLDDVIVFSPDNPYHFDFLLYEQKRGNARTVNIIDLLNTAIEIVEGKLGQDSGGGDSQFWKDASTQLLSKAVDMLLLTGENLTINNILTVINTAPTEREEVTKDPESLLYPFMSPTNEGSGEPPQFATPFAALFYEFSNRNYQGKLSQQEKITGHIMQDYFLQDYALLGERTRSSVKLHVTTTLYQLLADDLGLLLCSGRDDEYFTPPELTYTEGKIIILDMPVMKWKKAGKLMQGLYKYLFQRCIEVRNFKERTRPVFMWSDEAQYFLTSHDQLFLTTARSTGCCTVFLTQNIENFYEVIGEHTTRSLLGNLQTKIFHQNTDLATNNYASDLIGQEWQGVANRSMGENFTVGSSDQLIKRFPPENFNILKTGGDFNGLVVEGVVMRSGSREFSVSKFMQG